MSTHRVKIWDLPTRLFHWSLVVLIVVAWYTAEEGGLTLKYHMWCGYSVLSLVLFRFVWGICGSEPSRFASFVRNPAVVWRSVAELMSSRSGQYRSHNPLGGWVVMAFLLTLLAQAVSGLFANDDLFNEGPLYRLVSKAVSDNLTSFHHLNFSIISVLIALHVIAIGYHRLRKKETLVSTMIHGWRRLPADQPAPKLRNSWLALIIIVVVGAAVSRLNFIT